MDAREMNTLVCELVNYDAEQRHVNALEENGCVTVADVRYAMENPDTAFRQIGTGGWRNIKYALARFAANEPVENEHAQVAVTFYVSPSDYVKIRKAAGSDGVLVWGLKILREAAGVKWKAKEDR